MNSIEQQLRKHVTELDDYDAAADALRALRKLNSGLTEQLALEILTENKGDPYFQAFAFETLYAVNLHKAIELIKNPPLGLSPIILNAMIECITEDVGIVHETPSVSEAIEPLKKSIKNLSTQDVNRIKETIEWFQETYPDTSKT
ncbi:MAG: hypothetical protein ACN6O6_16010 [Pseudomonas sp.]|uniref:hypothetical protein n=1 Tax=Pseudomonas sp. TaxID=306 RepID=UPI003D0F28B9